MFPVFPVFPARSKRSGGVGRAAPLRRPAHLRGTRPRLRQGRRPRPLPALLAGERGAYRTFLTHTGEPTLVGAGPEVHVRMTGGTVVMNPVSGTFRYPPEGPDVDGLLEFLGDRKETARRPTNCPWVVDEELKTMCAVGDRGGVVIGLRFKEMAHLAHTEHELRGRSSLDVREVLKETTFAATVTGSPVQNACRVVERHESGGRGYCRGRARPHRTRHRGCPRRR
ncbi:MULTISPECIES: chorismate-binding protein [unclassified Streptomyces]|uniref:chorismate-binding protein n=1 Tax=unclassified Streptomyces TaxID=2593676 RepID=UPI003829C6F3